MYGWRVWFYIYMGKHQHPKPIPSYAVHPSTPSLRAKCKQMLAAPKEGCICVLSKCYDMWEWFICTREKHYNLCHLRDLWINIIIFLYFVIISWTQRSTAPQAQMFVILLCVHKCIHRCKYLTFLSIVHLPVQRCKNQKSILYKAHPESRERERERNEKNKERHANWTNEENSYQKVIMHIWNLATQSNIIFCIMCVCLWIFLRFILAIHDFSASKRNTICCVAVATTISVAIIATKRMLEHKFHAKQPKLLCNYLSTHVIWFLMHQFGNFCVRFQWKNCGIAAHT